MDIPKGEYLLRRGAFICGLILCCLLALTGCNQLKKETELFSNEVRDIQVSYYDSEAETKWNIGLDEISELKTWITNLELKHKYFEEGSSPSDSEGVKAFYFDINNGEIVFLYRCEGYVYFDEEWYEVMNPSNPPIEIPDQIENTVWFGDKEIDADKLSKETLEWLSWYNSLSEIDQLAISAIPQDLLEESGILESEDIVANTD